MLEIYIEDIRNQVEIIKISNQWTDKIYLSVYDNYPEGLALIFVGIYLSLILLIFRGKLFSNVLYVLTATMVNNKSRGIFEAADN